MKRAAFSAVACLVLALPASPAAAQLVTEYPVISPNAGPNGITVGPDGALWFTEEYSLGNKIGRITTAGTVTEYPIPTAGAVPWGITTGPDGNLWFTENGANKIARITPAGVVINEFGGLATNAQPTGIVAGPDGNLWFVEHVRGNVGRITTLGAVMEFPIPTVGSEPIDIALGPDGNLWFTEQVGKIGRITTAGVITEFPVGINTNPAGIIAGPDGNLWFAQGDGHIGRITTSGVVMQFPVPTSGESLHGVAVGSDGNIWFTDIGDRVGKITLAGDPREFAIPTSAGTPYGIVGGPDGALWFTELNGAKIGRITTSAQFYSITPCRVADTRGAFGPYGGPALQVNVNRVFVIGGQCGIPSTATGVSFNFTVTGSTAAGDLRAFPNGGGLPLVSTLNWRVGQTRANNAVVALGVAGDLAVHPDQANGTVHLILDVNGYFQ